MTWGRLTMDGDGRGQGVEVGSRRGSERRASEDRGGRDHTKLSDRTSEPNRLSRRSKSHSRRRMPEESPVPPLGTKSRTDSSIRAASWA